MVKSRKLSLSHKEAIRRSVKAYHSKCKRLSINEAMSNELNIRLKTLNERKKARNSRIKEITNRIEARRAKNKNKGKKVPKNN